MEDSWSSFEQESKEKIAREGIPSEQAQKLVDTALAADNELNAKLLMEMHAVAKQLQNRIDEVEEKLAEGFPEQAGSVTKDYGDFKVTCSRVERWTWERDGLHKKFAGVADDDLPAYVSRTTTIDKKTLEGASKNDYDDVKGFLTRKLIKPSLKVISKK